MSRVTATIDSVLQLLGERGDRSAAAVDNGRQAEYFPRKHSLPRALRALRPRHQRIAPLAKSGDAGFDDCEEGRAFSEPVKLVSVMKERQKKIAQWLLQFGKGRGQLPIRAGALVVGSDRYSPSTIGPDE